MDSLQEELARRSREAIEGFVAYFGEAGREAAVDAVQTGVERVIRIKVENDNASKLEALRAATNSRSAGTDNEALKQEVLRLRATVAGLDRENGQLRILRDRLNSDRTKLLAAVVDACNEVRNLENYNATLIEQRDRQQGLNDVLKARLVVISDRSLDVRAEDVDSAANGQLQVLRKRVRELEDRWVDKRALANQALALDAAGKVYNLRKRKQVS